ncbi:MAG: hypothetical protein JNM67_11350 [Bacteroidetes bacterium]|nr:hypothetical protein [Bacteroidota bacterium]
MSQTKEIELFYNWNFKDFPEFTTYNWMINDLYRGVQTDSNYLVTLGIIAYSEAIGWKIRGENDDDKDNWARFKAFTNQYMGYDFTSKASEKLYRNIRNELAHHYFIKRGKESIKKWLDKNNGPYSVISEVDGEITIFYNIFFNDFVNGVQKYLSELMLKRSHGVRSHEFGHVDDSSGYNPNKNS